MSPFRRPVSAAENSVPDSTFGDLVRSLRGGQPVWSRSSPPPTLCSCTEYETLAIAPHSQRHVCQIDWLARSLFLQSRRMSPFRRPVSAAENSVPASSFRDFVRSLRGGQPVWSRSSPPPTLCSCTEYETLAIAPHSQRHVCQIDWLARSLFLQSRRMSPFRRPVSAAENSVPDSTFGDLVRSLRGGQPVWSRSSPPPTLCSCTEYETLAIAPHSQRHVCQIDWLARSLFLQSRRMSPFRRPVSAAENSVPASSFRDFVRSLRGGQPVWSRSSPPPTLCSCTEYETLAIAPHSQRHVCQIDWLARSLFLQSRRMSPFRRPVSAAENSVPDSTFGDLVRSLRGGQPVWSRSSPPPTLCSCTEYETLAIAPHSQRHVCQIDWLARSLFLQSRRMSPFRRPVSAAENSVPDSTFGDLVRSLRGGQPVWSRSSPPPSLPELRKLSSIRNRPFLRGFLSPIFKFPVSADINGLSGGFLASRL